MANETERDRVSKRNSVVHFDVEARIHGGAGASPLTVGVTEGENPVYHPYTICVPIVSLESCSLRWERKVGGTFHPNLNIDLRPIVYKYREGKVQSTLKRGLNVPEIAVNHTHAPCSSAGNGCGLGICVVTHRQRCVAAFDRLVPQHVSPWKC